MPEHMIADQNGESLLIRSRKSAVFFERIADIEKPNMYESPSPMGQQHVGLVCISELSRVYRFTSDGFANFADLCAEIGGACWKDFTPRLATNAREDYADYYNREFDNNGDLSVRKHELYIEGPYNQPKTGGERVLFIKFNKRTFESFVYDLQKKSEVNPDA